MKTILFLLVMFKGDVRYIVQEYATAIQCQSELSEAVGEFKEHPEVKVIRTECIQIGQVVQK